MYMNLKRIERQTTCLPLDVLPLRIPVEIPKLEYRGTSVCSQPLLLLGTDGDCA